MLTEKEKKLLDEAFEQYNKAYIQKLHSDEKLKKITFSEKFEKQMKKLFEGK